MKVCLIRHGATAGNLEKRYIGTTDEPLSEVGREQILQNIKKGLYPQADLLIHTGMKRTMETAACIAPGLMQTAWCVRGLQECNFGLFEGKNYQELSSNASYQAWIESNGTLPFPEGEGQHAFEERVAKSFLQTLQDVPDTVENVAFCIHGGTIMAILHAFAEDSDRYQPNGKTYYDYMCGNGDCITLSCMQKGYDRTKPLLNYPT